MRIVTWTIRFVLFVLLVAFAAKNLQPVTLRFYFDLSRDAPLIVWLFAFFAAGVLFGIVALVATLLRQRREISSLRRKLAAAPREAPPPV